MTITRGSDVSIVTGGLTSYFAPLDNSRYYTSGSTTWTDRINQSNYFQMSASLYKKNMKVSESMTLTMNTNYDTFNLGTHEVGATLNFWFRTNTNNQYLFGKNGDHFSCYLTSENQLNFTLKPNSVYRSYNPAIVQGQLWSINSVGGNNSVEYCCYDSNSLELSASRWALATNRSLLSNNYHINSGYTSKWSRSLICANYSNIRNLPVAKILSYMNTQAYSTLVSRTNGVGVPETYASSIMGVAVDDDYVYYSDYSNHRVCKATASNGTYYTHSLCRYATGLDIDDDYVYALSYGSQSIYIFNKSDLSFVMTTGSATAQEPYKFGFGTTVSSSTAFANLKVYGNYVYVTDQAKYIKVFNKSDLTFVASHSVSRPIFGLTVDDNSIYYTTYLYGIYKIDKTTFVDISMNEPPSYNYYNLTAAGKSIEVDAGDGYVHLFDRSRYQSIWQKDSYGNMIFVSRSLLPTGYYADSHACRVDNGNYYVVCYDQHSIQKYTCPIITFVTRSGVHGAAGSDIYSYNNPRDIVFSGSYAYVSDVGNHRIKKLNKEDLTYVTCSISGTVLSPAWMDISGSYLFVGSSGQYQPVKILDTDLNYVSQSYLMQYPFCVRYDRYSDRIYLTGGGAGEYNAYYTLQDDPILEKKINMQRQYLATNTTEEFGYHSCGGGYYAVYDRKMDENYIYVAAGASYRVSVLNKNDFTCVNMQDVMTNTIVSKPITNLTSSEWTNISLIIASGSLKIYVNGEPNTSNSVPYNFKYYASGLDMTIGKWFMPAHSTTLTQWCTGSIGAIMRYNRALTDAEIQQNYTQLKKLFN